MVCNAGNKLQIKPLTCSISMHTLFNGFTAFRGFFLFNWLVTWTNCSFKHLPFHLQQTCSWWLHHFLYLHAILRLFDLLFPAQWPYCMHRREGGVSFSSPMQTQHSRQLKAALDIPKRLFRADSPSVNPETKQVSTPVIYKSGPA